MMKRNRFRRRSPLLGIMFIGLALLLVILLMFTAFSQSSKNDAAGLVNTFYSYEKSGDFGSAWKLFHPLMKEKFNQNDYIQKRAHVFMEDFGVKTFNYKVGEPEHLKSWKFVKTKFKDVYKVPITQSFQSEFGNFNIQQDVFVVKDKDEWTILWSYKN